MRLRENKKMTEANAVLVADQARQLDEHQSAEARSEYEFAMGQAGRGLGAAGYLSRRLCSWARDVPELTKARRESECLLARMRVLLFATLSLVPVFLMINDPKDPRVPLAALVVLTGFLLALALDIAARESSRIFLVGLIGTIADITLANASMIGLMVTLGAAYGINNSVVYPFLLLVIGMSTLRYDIRLCLIEGATALFQFALVVAAAGVLWHDSDPVFVGVVNQFDWTTQLTRGLLIVLATIIAGVSITRSRKLMNVSIRDHLTGLVNRRFFDERLREECTGTPRGTKFSVALVDVDHFKRFNDSYGHSAGDIALQILADVLKDSFRESNTIARYGGEEFALLIRHRDPDSTAERLDRARRILSTLDFGWKDDDGNPVDLTFSAGVIGSDEASAYSEMIYQADRRLYRAKDMGRNLVVTFDVS